MIWFVICLLIFVIFIAVFVRKSGKSSSISSSRSNSGFPEVYPNLSYSELFQLYLDAGNSLLKTLPLYSGDRFELMPFLFVIGFVSVKAAGGDAEKYSNEIEEFLSSKIIGPDWEYFEKRMLFYSDVAQGGPAFGFWSLVDIPPSILSIPMLRCAVAFGDCITNPDCVSDYENAPILLSGFSETQSFSRVFTDIFFRFSKTYCVAVAGGEFTPPTLK